MFKKKSTGRKPGHNASAKGFVSTPPVKPIAPTPAVNLLKNPVIDDLKEKNLKNIDWDKIGRETSEVEEFVLENMLPSIPGTEVYLHTTPIRNALFNFYLGRDKMNPILRDSNGAVKAVMLSNLQYYFGNEDKHIWKLFPVVSDEENNKEVVVELLKEKLSDIEGIYNGKNVEDISIQVHHKNEVAINYLLANGYLRAWPNREDTEDKSYERFTSNPERVIK